MMSVRFLASALFSLVALTAPAFASAAGPARPTAKEGRARDAAVPFTLDAQRILVNVVFEKPDGSARPALAWFNMGMPAPVLAKPLYRELGIDQGRPLKVRLGPTSLTAAPNTVVDGDGTINGDREFAHYFAPHPVEAVLPAGLLQDFVVTIDYGRRTLALTPPGAKKPEGTAVPFRLNPSTGFVTVDVTAGDSTYPFVLDAGSGYTWMRGEIMETWLAAHPEWRRAVGAVGQSNNAMVDYDFEKKATLVRVPEIAIGPVKVRDVGVLGTAPLLGRWVDGLIGNLFWDSWQKSASEPIAGWIGGNVLRQFKLTIDYPNRMLHWKRQGGSDPRDLDGIGITLVRKSGRYIVGNIVRTTSPGAPEADAVGGVKVGDELIAVGASPVQGATKETVLSALRGKPGERRVLTLERNGQRLNVEEPITSFQ